MGAAMQKLSYRASEKRQMTGYATTTLYKRARPSLLLDDSDIMAIDNCEPSAKASTMPKKKIRCQSLLYVKIISICGSQVVLQIGHLLSRPNGCPKSPRNHLSSQLDSLPKTCFYLKAWPVRKTCVPQLSRSLDAQLALQLETQSEQNDDMRKIVNGFPFFPRISGPENCICVQNKFEHVVLDVSRGWSHVHTYLPFVEIYYLFLHGATHNDIAERNLITIRINRPMRLICGNMEVSIECGLHLSLIDFGELTKIADPITLEESALADMRNLFCLLNNHLGYYKFIPVAEFRCPLTELLTRSMTSATSMMLRALSVKFVIK